MKLKPVVIIDSREQQPFSFANLSSERGTLDTGDYSVSGLTHLVAVERKSLPDLLACCGHGRDRFKRELQRLRGYRYRLLVIEADAADLERGDWRSKLSPQHVLGALSSWCATYNLPIWLGGDHETCGRFAERFLWQSTRHIISEYEAAAAFVAGTEGAA